VTQDARCCCHILRSAMYQFGCDLYEHETDIDDLQMLDMFEGKGEFTVEISDGIYLVDSSVNRQMTETEHNRYRYLQNQLWFKSWLKEIHAGLHVGCSRTYRLPPLDTENRWAYGRWSSDGTTPRPPVTGYFEDYDPLRVYKGLP
jgi:hypothetical protein